MTTDPEPIMDLDRLESDAMTEDEIETVGIHRQGNCIEIAIYPDSTSRDLIATAHLLATWAVAKRRAGQ